jgi:tetratricopeptide (TPR) repeat protein
MTSDAIAALDKIDPHAPAALASRLEYADFLAGSTSADCQQRLANAQLLLAMIAANPALEVTLPSGRARVANIEYRIHLARASCGSSPPDREAELREALAAAQRAVGLYRDALDYLSMAIAQFDVGVTYRMLGDDSAAIASLATAIDMDREYGFRQDAEDNYQLLMRWNPAAGVMQDFQSRSAALKFGWIANDADIEIQMDYTRAAADKINRAVGTALVKRHFRERHGDWVASYEPNMTANDADVRPNGAADLDKLAIIFTRALRQHPDIEVNDRGDLQEVVDSGKVARRLSAATQALIRERAPAAEIAARSSRRAAYEIDIAFGPQVIEATTAQDYSLETGAWIGATLEQGVWYNMSAALTMPGIEQILLPHDMEFAYTHNVPCTAGSTIQSCVELVIHATPQEDALKEFLKAIARPLHLRHGQTVHYWSTAYLRVVTDPNTLMTYASESRRYWYLSIDADPHGAENVSQRIVSTFAYH